MLINFDFDFNHSCASEFMLKLLESEFSSSKENHDALGRCMENVQQTSAEITNQIYMSEPNCNCLR